MVGKENWVIVNGTHEAIIDLETWEKTQKLLQKKHKDIDLETNKNIFAGFLQCGDCGRSMMKNTWRRADGTKGCSFYCGTYKRQGKAYCTPHALPFSVLEHIIMGDLEEIIKNIEDLQKLVESQPFPGSKGKEVTKQEIARVNGELERVKKLKKSVYEDYKEGLVTKEEFLAYQKDYREKEALYARQAKSLEEKSGDTSIGDIFMEPWIKRLLGQKNVEKLDRETVVEMIDQIIVYEGNRIKIRYNFGDELGRLFPSVSYGGID